MVVEPGDLILGDEDGLLSVPYAEVEEIYESKRQTCRRTKAIRANRRR